MSFRDSIGSLLHSRHQTTVREDWVEVVADVFDWKSMEPDLDLDEEATTVRGTLALTLNGERHYGLVYSLPFRKSDAKNFLNSTDRPTQIKVRYDPADPDKMFAVAKHADFPFEIYEEE